jgi:hypothetical protein
MSQKLIKAVLKLKNKEAKFALLLPQALQATVPLLRTFND